MKNLLIPFLIILVSCGPKKTENSLKLFGLNGEVKSIDQIVYLAIEKFGEVQNGELKSHKYIEFNSSGNIIEATIKLTQSKMIFNYDAQENQTERLEYRPIGTLYGKEVSEFNDQRNEIETKFYYEDTLSNINIHKYNKNGHRIETENYDSDGEFSGKDIYKFDESGNNIESSIYNSIGNLIQKETYKYDEKGNKIEYTNSQLMDDHKVKTEKFKYDNKKNQIETKHFNFDGKLWLMETRKFESNGLEIEIKSTFFNKNGEIEDFEIYKYEYDKENNWIRKIEFRNDKPTQRLFN